MTLDEKMLVEINGRIDRFLVMLKGGETGRGMKRIERKGVRVRCYSPSEKVKVEDPAYLKSIKNSLDRLLELSPVSGKYKEHIVNEFLREYNAGADYDIISEKIQEMIDPSSDIYRSTFDRAYAESIERAFFYGFNFIADKLNLKDSKRFAKEWEEDINKHYGKI